MEGIKYHKGKRDPSYELGIDNSDIDTHFIEGVNHEDLDDGETLYVQDSKVPVLIYKKDINKYRIYTNDSNAYIPSDTTPFFVVRWEELEATEKESPRHRKV